MCRGYTDEADRILNYLEYGIFDALQKQYLRRFIFAIYLDNKNPNKYERIYLCYGLGLNMTSIIEAYTFNFGYHTIPGTDTTIPIMTLGENLNKMSLQEDPLLETAKQGKVPTLKDVKKSVKTLLKTLITSMVQMDVLPKRRYASFKLFYTDDTPSDYEPPHFKAGHHEKDKWYFMTHDFDEAPDRWNVGKINSGYHSVEVNVSSIATYLPSSTEHENAPFTGLASSKTAVEPSLTPAEEATRRAEQTSKQMEDAESRKIVWAAEPGVDDVSDADGEYDIDDEYVASQSRTGPIGIKGADGTINPLPDSVARMDVDEVHVFGETQTVPLRLHDILAKNVPRSSAIPETQSVDMSQEEKEEALPTIEDPTDDSSVLDTPTPMIRRGTRARIMSPPSSPISPSSAIQETRIVVDLTTGEDTEMLDLETQPANFGVTHAVDAIESFEDDQAIDEIQTSPKKAITKKQTTDEGLQCECGIPESDGDECCYCEGGCKRWYHLWCMGYHSADDRRLPEAFTCFDCTVHADPSWELIKVDLYPTMMNKFKELATFRHAIKVAEKYNPSTLAEFAKKMKCNHTEARPLFKRLETEGSNHHRRRDRSLRNAYSGQREGKAKAAQRRNVQKSKYIFNRQSLKTQAYKDYFNPDREVENRLLGIPKTGLEILIVSEQKANIKPRKIPVPQVPQAQRLSQSQTQEESLVALELFPPATAAKRTSEDHDTRPKKKTKISLAPPVDLAE
ncbi:hypothetical protein VNI00_009416 [Paramarasmius palmivorus]|uniref:HORMA domain-containing protein n=1 Tax=Paramarasmius palmivorus TaxID=297713 RepID=A0AAW0CS64_9AGAR